jgi:hypothetical protein
VLSVMAVVIPFQDMALDSAARVVDLGVVVPWARQRGRAIDEYWSALYPSP